jgi:hypothetical protein
LETCHQARAFNNEDHDGKLLWFRYRAARAQVHVLNAKSNGKINVRSRSLLLNMDTHFNGVADTLRMFKKRKLSIIDLSIIFASKLGVVV